MILFELEIVALSVIAYFAAYTFSKKDYQSRFKRLFKIILLMLILNNLAYFVNQRIDYYMLFLTTLLIIFSIIDIRKRIVPTRYVILFLILTVYFFHDDIYQRLMGGIITFGVMYLIGFLVSKALKKEALGGGDMQLYLIIGYLLNPVMAFVSLFFASAIGLVHLKLKKIEGEFPFVPYISLGVYIVILFYSEIYQIFLF